MIQVDQVVSKPRFCYCLRPKILTIIINLKAIFTLIKEGMFKFDRIGFVYIIFHSSLRTIKHSLGSVSSLSYFNECIQPTLGILMVRVS